ncbi:hypothetical protein [Urechidicola croceus]|uniref:Uncharacterized protein n=1 Tax=Urechidicola croceus TaxID=1850246 RepID=A0A1D8PB08_9FLAO|nr:hypothetical protein [Urechidicola croceus]AOW21755.1 hypothetical protein LPB138_14175 [Urechidicola croceus]
MPANPKYLTTSFWHRFAKITAGILGGFLISAEIHMVLAYWIFDHKIILITSVFTLFIFWVTFMIIPFLFKNGWKIFGFYMLTILILGIAVYFGKIYQPII